MLVGGVEPITVGAEYSMNNYTVIGSMPTSIASTTLCITALHTSRVWTPLAIPSTGDDDGV